MSVQGDPASDLQQSGVLACVGLLVVQCKGQSQPCWFKATQRSLCCLCRRAWFAMLIQSNSAVPVFEKNTAILQMREAVPVLVPMTVLSFEGPFNSSHGHVGSRQRASDLRLSHACVERFDVH